MGFLNNPRKLRAMRMRVRYDVKSYTTLRVVSQKQSMCIYIRSFPSKQDSDILMCQKVSLFDYILFPLNHNLNPKEFKAHPA